MATRRVARHSLRRWALPLWMAATAACGPGADTGADLRATRDVLAREVEGLRTTVDRLGRGEPLFPEGDMTVGVDDTLVRELVLAQLPFETEVDRVHVRLTAVDVQFSGSPTLQLRGRLQLREQPDVTTAVTLFGALDDIRLDQESSTLRATVTADQLVINDATGLAQYLSGAALDQVAEGIRQAIAAQLPVVRIPIAIRREVELPALEDGPLRLAAGRLALDVAVSQIVAARGRLWVSIRVTPGALETVPDGPAEARP